MQRTRLKTFCQSRVVVVVDVVIVRCVRVGVESWFSQLVHRTRLETFRQSREIFIVDDVVWRVRVCGEIHLSQLVQRTRLETFRQSRVVVIVDVVVWRVRVCGEIHLSQLVQRTRLETFRQSRVVVIVDVVVVVVVIFVGAYSPVTGYRARQLRGSTPRDDAGPMNLVVAYSGPVLAVAGAGTGEGCAVSGDAPTPLGVGAPPDKGVDASPGKGSRTSLGKDSAGAIRMARLLLALSSDVTATDDEAMRAFSTGSSSFTLTPLDVDAPPDKGVDAPSDKGSRNSPGKDSAGAIRVLRLLLALSLGVTVTDDEAMRAFSTGSSSFAIPNDSSATGPPKEIACSARGVNGQGRVLHPSVAAVWTGPNDRALFSSSTRALAGLAAG